MYIIIPDEEEIFKKCTYPTVRTDAYMISNYGRIYSNITHKYQSETIDSKGYVLVMLCRNAMKGCNFKVHRLVAWEFCNDQYRDGYQVNHLDSDRTNNFYKNLEWVSVRDNVLHSFSDGYRVSKKGEDHYRNKYKKETIAKIKTHISEGLSNIEIMNIFGYTMGVDNFSLYNLIVDIRRGRVWK